MSQDGGLLCITPAPAIDRTAHVERVEPDVILRPTELVALPGGKGVNAARAARHLGGSVLTTGIAGGYAGRWIVAALEEEGLPARWSSAAAESRTTYVTVDDAGTSIIVYERPGLATEAEYAAFLRLLADELLPRSAHAIVAGSVPTGLDPRSHGAIVEVARAAGCPLLVDGSGAGLRAALAAGPDIVKIGRIEAVEAGLVGAEAGALEAALALVAHGASLGIITDGASEVAAADANHTWRVSVPRVRAVNAVGSGDAFNAALSLALMADASIEAALRAGVAAGSANALTLSAAMLDPVVARDLQAQVAVRSERR
jgi:1-phosphofructokinase family hexose kinase